jgi:hypothetical protein
MYNIHTNIHTCIHTYIHTYMCVCVCVYVYAYIHAYIHNMHTHIHTIHMYIQATLLCPLCKLAHIYLASDEFLVESLARGDPELARSHLRQILPVSEDEQRMTLPSHVGTGAAREEREVGGKGGRAPWALAVSLTTLGSSPRAAQQGTQLSRVPASADMPNNQKIAKGFRMWASKATAGTNSQKHSSKARV